MDKVVELDSMADETTLAAAVTAKEEAIKIKHGTERSVLLHHRGDALGTLRLLTKLKNLPSATVSREQIFDLFCDLLDCYTVRGHQNFCASKLGKHKTVLARCIDGSVGDSETLQAAEHGERVKALDKLDKKYKVLDGTIGFEVGGLLFMKDDLWQIIGFYEPQTKDPTQPGRTGKWLMIHLSVVNSLSIREKKVRILVKLLSFNNGHAACAESVFWSESMLYVGKQSDSIQPSDDFDIIAAVRWSDALRFTFSNRTACCLCQL